MGNARLHRILRFRVGSHHLPIEECRHVNQPWASCVCHLCMQYRSIRDERRMLLKCPALTGLRLQFFSLLLSCFSFVMLL